MAYQASTRVVSASIAHASSAAFRYLFFCQRISARIVEKGANPASSTTAVEEALECGQTHKLAVVFLDEVCCGTVLAAPAFLLLFKT